MCHNWANMDIIHRNVDTNMEVKNRFFSNFLTKSSEIIIIIMK